MSNKKIGYIIPLHKKDERVYKAIASVPENDIALVCCPEDVAKWISNDHDDWLKVDGSSYQKLVNAGIDYFKETDADYISILEFDDTLTPNAGSIVSQYGTDWEDVDILAPLSMAVKEGEDDKPILIAVANEAAMAPQLAEEHGYFDFNMMLRSNFLFVNGCYIKPEVFENFGKFKENFKMFYDYEWALRMVYNGAVIRSIPKATRFHYLSDGGAFETQRNAPKADKDNWLSAARREYFFEEDREISFE